jgi:hypothetical protein
MRGIRRRVIGALLAALVYAACAEPQRSPNYWEACARSMRLVPVERQGLPWERHLRYLEGSGEFDESNYVIVNLSTSRLYRWGWLGNYDGRARFGVSTWWAWRNPSWKQDRWLLLYNCASS